MDDVYEFSPSFRCLSSAITTISLSSVIQKESQASIYSAIRTLINVNKTHQQLDVFEIYIQTASSTNMEVRKCTK